MILHWQTGSTSLLQTLALRWTMTKFGCWSFSPITTPSCPSPCQTWTQCLMIQMLPLNSRCSFIQNHPLPHSLTLWLSCPHASTLISTITHVAPSHQPYKSCAVRDLLGVRFLGRCLISSVNTSSITQWVQPFLNPCSKPYARLLWYGSHRVHSVSRQVRCPWSPSHRHLDIYITGAWEHLTSNGTLESIELSWSAELFCKLVQLHVRVFSFDDERLM